jgi:sugar phosphate isomerase/epimerase
VGYVELKLFRHLWGVDEAWETTFPKFKAAGYAGIESGLPAPADEARFRALLTKYDLSFIAQIFTAGDDLAAHVQSFHDQLARAASFNPVHVNCHGGRDAWSADEGQRFYAAALVVERDAPVAVAHETHRGRILYNPWITRNLLQQFPDLKLSCDFSHWVCVAERLLTTEDDIMSLAAERALHIHARVGYEEGPQVPDPRMPQFATHLVAHETWWDMVWDSQAARGMQISTLTPEFGPPLYQHTLPPDGTPIGNLAEICEWQAVRQAQRFANR